MGNPWITIWTEPKQTVRALIQVDSHYGYWVLAGLYGLSSCFYGVHLYSWSLAAALPVSWLPLLMISPVLGAIALNLEAWILYWISKLFKGVATYSEVRCAVAWAKIPLAIGLLMWVCFAVFSPHVSFIEYLTGVSVVFIIFIFFAIYLWSAVLLIEEIVEIQFFSEWKSLSVVCIGSCVLIFIYLMSAVLVNYAVNKLSVFAN